MDQVYKAGIPRHRKRLLALKREFSRVHSATDWVALRIEPLLDHVTSLERRLRAAKFARESGRLRRGVRMFHADLVYLRANIQALEAILADEARRTQTARKRPNKSA